MLSSMLQNAIDLVFVLSVEGELKWHSPSVERALGRDAETLAETTLWSLVHDDDLEAVKTVYQSCVESAGSAPRLEFRMCGSDGELWLADGIFQNLNENPQVGGMVLTARHVIRSNLVDTLTGLPNRASFLDCLSLQLRRAEEDPECRFAVLVLGLDRFKVINDGMGHAAGDLLLASFARLLESCLGPGDSAARLDGDQFMLLLTSIDDEEGALRLMRRLEQLLKTPFRIADKDVFTSVSAGIALSRKGYDSAEDLLRAAETAMHSAKAGGRARAETFSTVMHLKALKELSLDTDIRKAVERDELRVYYQPIIALGSGSLFGFEALVRWQHPEKGFISPADFIPIAEQTGLIALVDQWVLRRACTEVGQWQQRFSEVGPLTLCVNVSSKHFSDTGLVDQVVSTLEETSFAASSLKLEVTESAVMDAPTTAATILTRLRELGIRLALDDFGTGYSSLSHLHSFPFDTLKIDQSFVNRMGGEEGSPEIIKTIIGLADGLLMDVVAEGIETDEQRLALRELGCGYGQGYFFDRPLQPEHAEALIASRSEAVTAQAGASAASP